MATAGYSGTPLPRKLGIKPGHTVLVRNGPPDFGATLGDLPDGATIRKRSRHGRSSDVTMLFCSNSAELRRGFASAAESIRYDGSLWVAWPKKSSGVTTDLTENVVREHGLRQGLVDNKVCAIDETWSGLRFVYRLEDRPKM